MKMNFKRLTFLLSIIVLLASSAHAQKFKYIGASKCKMCHNKVAKGEQYKKWAAGPHAKAMESLKGEEAKDPKCLKCHSTIGGVDKSLVASLKITDGVSCESCHGAGSSHLANTAARYGRVELPVCTGCHNLKNSPDFDFYSFLPRITHSERDAP